VGVREAVGLGGGQQAQVDHLTYPHAAVLKAKNCPRGFEQRRWGGSVFTVEIVIQTRVLAKKRGLDTHLNPR
jgi:hypothetical protein